MADTCDDLDALLSDERSCKSSPALITLLSKAVPAALQVADGTLLAPAAPGHQNKDEGSDGGKTSTNGSGAKAATCDEIPPKIEKNAQMPAGLCERTKTEILRGQHDARRSRIDLP